jgi:hypothetical protein
MSPIKDLTKDNSESSFDKLIKSKVIKVIKDKDPWKKLPNHSSRRHNEAFDKRLVRITAKKQQKSMRRYIKKALKKEEKVIEFIPDFKISPLK